MKKPLRRRKKTSESRGSDDPFYKLMHTGGEAILKLVGAASPEDYTPKAVVLKEKKLYPDIIAEPKSGGDKVFIEFQGYSDPMIRYSLTSKITAYCAREGYSGTVLGVIIYTDKSYEADALGLDIASISGNCRIFGEFKEIVLSDYTEPQLTSVDPRLIVLAPFTIPKSTKHEQLAGICRKWKKTVEISYSDDVKNESMEILGLFMLNRFRKLSVKEVIAMLHLNLEETKAGRELISIGVKKGESIGVKKGELKNSKKLLIDAINEKFGNIPDAIASSIKRMNEKQFLDALFKKVFHCQTIDEFSEAFRQAKI